MKPYYEEPGITIYHGDCRDILPHLPKVDLVLTDPPYGAIGGSKAIGVEIEERYCEIAVKRLQQECLPFATESNPKAALSPETFFLPLDDKMSKGQRG